MPMPPFEPANEGEEKRLKAMQARREARQRRFEEIQAFEPLHEVIGHGKR